MRLVLTHSLDFFLCATFSLSLSLPLSMAENIPLVLDSVRGFVVALQTDTPRPEYVWTKDPETGALHVEISAKNPPSSVQVWHAKTSQDNNNTHARKGGGYDY